MNYPLLAISQPAPPGFSFVRAVTRADVRRSVFALFAASLAEAQAVLLPFASRAAGLIVTPAPEFLWAETAPGLFHLGVPEHANPTLPTLLQPLLDSIERAERFDESHRAEFLELQRAREDRTRLVHEFAQLRASLLDEIGERRAAERALRSAHDELEVRVEQRTEQLARVNEALCTEIAERHRADRALVEERQRLSTLLESVPDGIVFKDREGCILQINRALADRFGAKSPAEVVGRNEFEFVPAAQAQSSFEDELQVMHTDLPMIGKIERVPHADGRIEWVSMTKMPLHDAEGTVIGTFGVSREITSLKRAEEELRETNERLRDVLEDLTRSHEELKGAQLQLIQAEKMQSVGRLAAGVAHEVKNPLAIIAMGLECLGQNGDFPPEQTASVVQEMRDAVKRASTVVGGLLDFSSSNQLALQPTDLNALIDNALRLMKHELITGKITAVRRLDRKMPLCRLDANKIEQVLINLLSNACQAMPNGGHITIGSHTRAVTEAETQHAAGERSAARFWTNQRVAEIEIRDTGPGIPPAELPKIFDPFFTTRPTGKGTGLGLTVARKIIDLHGGTLTIANYAEGGVLVTLVLKVE